MSNTGILNPLTIAALEETPGGRQLVLRSYAPGRSLVDTVIEQDKQPALFECLTGWIDNGQPEVLTDLTREEYFWLWSQGLLLADREASAIAEDAAPGFDPAAVAIALYPPLRDFMTRPFAAIEPDEAAAASFGRHGACLLAPIFTAADFAAVKGYYRLLQDGNWLKPDRHLTTQKVVRNDPVARHILAGCRAMISSIAGEEVTPTFTYATEYHGQADVPRHKDRIQCSFVISLFVEYRPDDSCGPCPWPLHLHTPAQDLTLAPEPGGGILFRGIDLEHSRPALPEGARSMQLLFCFAPEGFSGPLV